jgi:threonine dehydrogenase-like Zn-dependent dehydrogenase
VRALTWQGREKVSVETVPDPRIEAPTDAIIRVTSSGLCGSDLHLYSTLGMYLNPGDILGHEPMGIVEEVGTGVTHISPGDRVVVPFNISCGSCWTCSRQLYAQCETTQVRAQGKGASLFGYTEMYGSVPGGQAELLRVPQAHFGPIKVPHDGPDEQYLYLSDVLPTAWQAVEYALVPQGGTVVVLGLGPIGQMCARIALHRGAGQVIGVDTVHERQDLAARHGVTVLDGYAQDVLAQVLDLTGGRGADSVIDAVGMEAHGAPVAEVLQKAAGLLPDAVAQKVTETVGFDRLSALYAAFTLVRRGGTVSISGVYGGALDPMPMMDMFDKGLTVKMGQAHVRRWTDELIPLCADPADPLGVLDLQTHRVPLEDAADWYGKFQRKDHGAIKIVFAP